MEQPVPSASFPEPGPPRPAKPRPPRTVRRQWPKPRRRTLVIGGLLLFFVLNANAFCFRSLRFLSAHDLCHALAARHAHEIIGLGRGASAAEIDAWLEANAGQCRVSRSNARQNSLEVVIDLFTGAGSAVFLRYNAIGYDDNSIDRRELFSLMRPCGGIEEAWPYVFWEVQVFPLAENWQNPRAP